MKAISISTILVLVILATSCTTTTLTRGAEYARMYEQQPKSIVVMPPINETNFGEAKDYFYTTMALPLIDKGYYVYSPYLTMEMFQNEGAYDSELFIDQDLNQFRNVLACDAVMFTRIKKWEKKALSGKINVEIEYLLRSATTGETLYHREGKISLDTSIQSGGGGGFGALANLVATAVNTAVTDKVIAGRACNQYVLSDMPEGPYSPKHMHDQEEGAWNGIVQGTVKAK